MKQLLSGLKHTPSTLVGLLLIAAAIFLLVTGKIEFNEFKGYATEAVLLIAGIGAALYKPTAKDEES